MAAHVSRMFDMEMTAIDPVKIDNALNSNGYLIIHDPELEQLSQKARAEYDRCLQASKLHATREKFHYSILAQEPWRKLAIGGSNGLGYQYAQNLQSIYFDANDKNYPALGALFGFMVKVRNRLMGVAPDFGSNPERDRFWNACRIHHYPRGGGFMATHRDTHFPHLIKEQLDKPFYQVSVLLSRKGEDFVSGGGIVQNRQGNTIDLEKAGGFGTMVIFDGRTPHGVDDVDLDQVIDFTSPSGRLAAFVNLYAVLVSSML